MLSESKFHCLSINEGSGQSKIPDMSAMPNDSKNLFICMIPDVTQRESSVLVILLVKRECILSFLKLSVNFKASSFNI